ncbi:FAD/FMN-binding family oxidoreductase (macronuclear) [Tetrahymena thermophila SB210]|uniref:FAD/FMN-binding family oxidoreductase n=1 Tax=Tetrahymena thermophila (strain SB210) TaxID=312017 RepID=Q235W3_TETTS|nr:FAD/FMN-binding family oxidoreductase [Tetrahymena thermophila SB210]EAR92637.2 FAD/FMN-binding family oxidoreductase [Tetrahymena thermophila SB210]|eukprot:XP_001012882.2 FAD/FMN-binding family oxidoreductase [Tetrahymena thermophila SB210]
MMGCSSSQQDVSIQQNKKSSINPYFESSSLGSIKTKNRIIMAGMSRLRADPKTNIPNDLMAEYYSQRASFGAIITESSAISSNSNAFPGSGNIYTLEQVEGWKKVVDKVHQNGGKIIIQLFHCGRVALPSFIGGELPIAPSPIGLTTPHFFTKQSYPVPKEMNKQDILNVIEQFKNAAINAKKANFDGIQLHAGNGYLIDQFLRDGTNKRTDDYGGSIPNRARFLLEVIDSISQVFGYDKIGVRLTPTGRYNEMYDSNPLELVQYLLKQFEKRNLGFVELKRHDKTNRKNIQQSAADDGLVDPELQMPNFFDSIRGLYKGCIILNDGITYEEGLKLLQQNKGDFISFGRYAVSNPDLPQRFQNNWELSDADQNTFYRGGDKGYVDYLTYEQSQSKNKS